MADEQPPPLAHMTDAEIRELANHLRTGRVYTTQTVPKNLLTLVFLPLMFMVRGFEDQEAFVDYYRDKVAYGIYGVHHTIDRSVNGYPIFTEFKIAYIADYNRAIQLAQAMEDALAALPVPPTAEASP